MRIEPQDVALSGVTSGFMAVAGTIQINAGSHADHGDIRFACAAGEYDCTVMVMVANDGTITATSTGGMVTATNSDSYRMRIEPQDVALSGLTIGYLVVAGTVDIKAGESEDLGDIKFTCAAGPFDCTVVVTVGTDGSPTATSTGGMVSAEDAGDPNSPANVVRDDVLGMGINQSSAPNLMERSGEPDDASGFMETADAAVADIEDWDHTAYGLVTSASEMTPASTQTLVIYRNTEYETDTPFADVYAIDVDGDGDTQPDSINVANYNSSLVAGVNLPTTVSTDGTFPGTFDGARGEYTCTDGSSCELSFDSGGNVINVVGTMHFTPDAGAIVSAPDPDYIYFGYWNREGTNGSGDPDFELAEIFGGQLPSNISDVQTLEGEAEYTGAATGLYVRRYTDSDGDVVRRRSGQFTADAALTAYFGGPTVAQVNHYMIEGMISNFMEGDRAVDPSWRLELGRTGFDAGSSVVNGVFTGPTQDVDADGNPIAATTDTGDWEGQFFGEVALDADSTTDGNQSTLPSGIVGAFDGHFTNGVVVGAFGAENEE